MPPDSTDPKERQAQMLVLGIMAACLAAASLLVPAAMGLGLYWLLRGRLGRREWVVGAVVSGVVTVLGLSFTVGAYFSWLRDVVFSQQWTPVPWVALVVLPVLFACLCGAFEGTTTAESVMVRLHLRQESDDDELIPTSAEVAKVSRMRPGVSETVVRQEDHSIHTGGVPGSRFFPVGLDRYGKTVLLGEEEVKTHVVVLGATGSGKTETLKNLAGNLLDLGWQVVTIDLKEDTAPGGLRDFLRSYAWGHALGYQQLTLSDPTNDFWFNPLYGMEPDEAINAILSLQTFDDGYWQAINRTMIGQIVTLFYDAHRVDPARFPAPDMYNIAITLRQPDLKAATKDMVKFVVDNVPGREVDNFGALVKPTDDERKSAGGLGARIVNMYESEAGRQVLRASEGTHVIDVTAGGVCYIGLNTLGLSELARVVSTSVLLRLATVAGARTTGQVDKGTSRIAVIIDEANWIDRKQVQNLLSRARSAGITVVLATQGANDWNDENGQDWEKIVNNVNVGLIMRQGGPESADLCAEYIGKRKKTSLVNQVLEGEMTGSGSMREVEEFWVSPDQLRELQIGQAVLRVGVPAQRLQWMRVNLREPEVHVGGHVRAVPGPAPAAPDAERGGSARWRGPRPPLPFSGEPVDGPGPGAGGAPDTPSPAAPAPGPGPATPSPSPATPSPSPSPAPAPAAPAPDAGDGWVSL